MLFLVPLFAFIVNLFYRNRRRRYGEHLIFCLHAQSFLLLMLLAEASAAALLAPFLSLWIVAYFFLALRRVYGGSRTETVLRGSGILLLLTAGFLIFGAALV